MNREEIKKYYRDIDYSAFEKSIIFYHGKLAKLKTEKARKIWSLKLYAEYLQLIEIFCINIFAISENSLWNNIFLSNNDLRLKIEERLYKGDDAKYFNNSFIDYFLDNWIFCIKDKKAIRGYHEKKNLYITLMREVIEDYINDYDLLNAYKHGFRTRSDGKTEVSIKATDSSGPSFSLGRFNSTITYFTKEFDEKLKAHYIYEKTLAFNWERVIQKCYFLLNMQKQTRETLLFSGKEIIIQVLSNTIGPYFHKWVGSYRQKVAIVKMNKKCLK